MTNLLLAAADREVERECMLPVLAYLIAADVHVTPLSLVEIEVKVHEKFLHGGALDTLHLVQVLETCRAYSNVLLSILVEDEADHGIRKSTPAESVGLQREAA